MNLRKDEIYTFKLNSGEELIAKIINIEESSILISEPVSIGPGPSGSLGLVPSMFTYNPKGEVRLNTNSVSMFAETDESVKTKYIQATTGIKLPEKKLILG